MYRHYEGQDRGLATAFAHDASQMDSLGRLTKYETALERRFQRLLHELQRLQATRAGQHVPPPAMVDVYIALEDELAHPARTCPAFTMRTCNSHPGFRRNVCPFSAACF